VLQPNFDSAPAAVCIYRCRYISRCKARNCLARATVVAEKVDCAGRHVRQIELCARHYEIVIARERARGFRDFRPTRRNAIVRTQSKRTRCERCRKPGRQRSFTDPFSDGFEIVL
jgi:hypothetical protein